MTKSRPLTGHAKPFLRLLVYLASTDLKAEQSIEFSSFANGFRSWSKHTYTDHLINYCLKKLCERELIVCTGTLAGGDLTLAPTALGLKTAQEIYLLAEQGTDGFTDLLPRPAAAEAEQPPATAHALLCTSPLGARPQIRLTTDD